MVALLLGYQDIDYNKRSDGSRVLGRKIYFSYPAFQAGVVGQQVKEEFISSRVPNLYEAVKKLNLDEHFEIDYFTGADGKAVVSAISQ